MLCEGSGFIGVPLSGDPARGLKCVGDNVITPLQNFRQDESSARSEFLYANAVMYVTPLGKGKVLMSSTTCVCPSQGTYAEPRDHDQKELRVLRRSTPCQEGVCTEEAVAQQRLLYQAGELVQLGAERVAVL